MTDTLANLCKKKKKSGVSGAAELRAEPEKGNGVVKSGTYPYTSVPLTCECPRDPPCIIMDLIVA